MSRVIQVKDIAEINHSTFKKDEFPPIIKYLDTSSLTKNKIENFQILDTAVDIIPSRAQRKIKRNTILYSTVRPNQEHYGIIEKLLDDVVVSTGFVTIDVNDDEIYPKYLFYLLTQSHITSYLHTIATNSVSAYPSISSNDIGNLKFRVPNFSSQEKIASVLSALDSKIELNNRINAELEAMAKAIYDYWFVQFDFLDKNGKPYKSSGGKMVYNEELKREIPEGWVSAELKDIANITMGQSPPGESYNEICEGVVFYQGCTDFGSRFPSIRQYTTEPSRYARPGDILLSVRAPVGTMNISITECCIGRGLAALNSKDNCTPFLFEVLRNLKQVFDRRNTDGTTFGAITKDDLFSLKVVKPTENVLNEFSLIFQSVFEKQNTIALENYKLSELRDWLLPMLMNGQVKVN